MMNNAPATWKNTYDIWLSSVTDTYRELISAAATLVPRLLGSLLLLLLGWLLAVLLRRILLRLGSGLDGIFDRARQRTGQTWLKLRWPLSRIVAGAAYWLTLLFFLAAAADLAEVPGVTELLARFLLYLPVVIATAAGLLVIVLISGAIADFVERVSAAEGLANAALLGHTVRVLVVIFAVIIALGQIGIDVTLLINIATVVAAVFLGGAALAFGLGASGDVRNSIASHYVRQVYQVGQRVRIADLEGEILEFTRVGVVLDTAQGRTLVPARKFGEDVSVLLEEGRDDA